MHVYPGDPCPFVPGSEGKVAWLASRYQAGFRDLWSDGDATYEKGSDEREKRERAERLNALDQVFLAPDAVLVDAEFEDEFGVEEEASFLEE